MAAHVVEGREAGRLPGHEDAGMHGQIATGVASEDGDGELADAGYTMCVDLTAVDYLIDGQLAATVTSAPYTWLWSTVDLLDGPHTLRAEARNELGVGSADGGRAGEEQVVERQRRERRDGEERPAVRRRDDPTGRVGHAVLARARRRPSDRELQIDQPFCGSA